MQVIFWISFGALWLIVAIQGFAFLEILRQIGLIRKQMQVGQKQGTFTVPTAEAGKPVPEISGSRAADLLPANWDDYLRTDIGMIILLSTHCVTCRVIAEDLSRFAAEIKDKVSIVAFVQGPLVEAQAFVTNAHLDRGLVVLDEEGITAQRFGVAWNPGVVTIRERTIDQVGVVNSVDQLDELIHAKEKEHVVA